jgi:hypothetical protein
VKIHIIEETIQLLEEELNNTSKKIHTGRKKSIQEDALATEMLAKRTASRRVKTIVLIKTCQSLKETKFLAEISRRIRGSREIMCQILTNNSSK